MKLTVVVPVYNVEDSLHRCITSVLDNDLDPNDFEIVIVDDESPDNSLQIAREFENSNSNVKVISQKNKGLGGARNTGISAAKGDYLMFLDSDDYLTKNTLKALLETTRDNTPDILEFGASVVDLDGNRIQKIEIIAPELYDGVTYWQSFDSINSACNKLYNSEFLKGNKLEFKEKIFAEDFEFNTRALFFAHAVTATPLEVANFVRSENSITRNKNKESKQKYISDFITILGFIDAFHKEVNTKHSFFEERLTMLNVDLFLFMAKNGFDAAERRKIKQLLKDKGLFYTSHKLRDFRKNLIRIAFRYLPVI